MGALEVGVHAGRGPSRAAASGAGAGAAAPPADPTSALVPLLVEHHNATLRRGVQRAYDLEQKLAGVLQPVLDRAARASARRFTQAATRTLSASAGVGATSTMVALKPTPEQAQAIASAGGEAPATLHVTLAYLGKLQDSLDPVRAALAKVAGAHAPLQGEVGGVACFAGGEHGHPAVLLPSVPGLAELRVAVTQALAEAGIEYGREYGFVPHLTVDYTEGEPPGEGVLGEPLDFADLLVVRGDRVEHLLPLTGAKPLTAGTLATGIAPDDAADGDRFPDTREPERPPGWLPPAPDEYFDVEGLVSDLRLRLDPIRNAHVEQVVNETLAEARRQFSLSAAATTTPPAGQQQPPPVGIAFDVTNPAVVAILGEAGAHITDIAKRSQRQLAALIQDAYAKGLSIPDTAALIRGTMQGISEGRARTIARTELAGATNGGSLAATQMVDGMLGGGQFDKTWLTAPGAVYPRHEDYDGLDGQTVPLEEFFQVGDSEMQYPGDPNGDPGETINCRCTITYADHAGGVMAEASAEEPIDPAQILEDVGGVAADELASELGGEALAAPLPEEAALADYGVRLLDPIPGPDTGISALSREGPGNSETLAEQSSARRGTGHFGTGTYFVSTPERLGRLAAEERRAVKGIDLRGLHLYRPLDPKLALKLHDTLGRIDDLVARELPPYEGAFRFQLEGLAIDLPPGANGELIYDALRSARADLGAGNLNSDSAATRVMKALGYDGIDVRALEGLDNTKYGSVVYRRGPPPERGAAPLAREQPLAPPRSPYDMPETPSPDAITNGPATEMLDKAMAEWGAGLSEQELLALRGWKRELGFRAINEYLRTGKASEWEIEQAGAKLSTQDVVAKLDDLLARSPALPESVQTTVYRGVEDVRAAFGDLPVKAGLRFTDPGYESVTTEEQVAHDYTAYRPSSGIFRIELPEGYRGTAWMRSAGLEKTDPFYDANENHELLIRRGQQWEVTKVAREQGFPVITLRPVSDEQLAREAEAATRLTTPDTLPEYQTQAEAERAAGKAPADPANPHAHMADGTLNAYISKYRREMKQLLAKDTMSAADKAEHKRLKKLLDNALAEREKRKTGETVERPFAHIDDEKLAKLYRTALAQYREIDNIADARKVKQITERVAALKKEVETRGLKLPEIEKKQYKTPTGGQKGTRSPEPEPLPPAPPPPPPPPPPTGAVPLKQIDKEAFALVKLRGNASAMNKDERLFFKAWSEHRDNLNDIAYYKSEIADLKRMKVGENRRDWLRVIPKGVRARAGETPRATAERFLKGLQEKAVANEAKLQDAYATYKKITAPSLPGQEAIDAVSRNDLTNEARTLWQARGSLRAMNVSERDFYSAYRIFDGHRRDLEALHREFDDLKRYGYGPNDPEWARLVPRGGVSRGPAGETPRAKAERYLRALQTKTDAAFLDARRSYATYKGVTAKAATATDKYVPPTPPKNERMQRLQSVYAQRYNSYVREGAYAGDTNWAEHKASLIGWEQMVAAGADFKAEIEARMGEVSAQTGKIAALKDTRARQAVIQEILSEIRGMGTADPLAAAERSDELALEWARKSAGAFPSDWWLKVKDNDISVRLDTSGRAGYSPGANLMRLQADRWGKQTYLGQRVALHELSHFWENNIPGLRQAEREYYAHRCEGEMSFNPGDPFRENEWFRKDKFVDLYFGKDYEHMDGPTRLMPSKEQTDFELLACAMEALYTDSYDMWMRDPETTQWLLGLLVSI
jgi:2'-5' RNA ligase